jgi:hypothetical protein
MVHFESVLKAPTVTLSTLANFFSFASAMKILGVADVADVANVRYKNNLICSGNTVTFQRLQELFFFAVNGLADASLHQKPNWNECQYMMQILECFRSFGVRSTDSLIRFYAPDVDVPWMCQAMGRATHELITCLLAYTDVYTGDTEYSFQAFLVSLFVYLYNHAHLLYHAGYIVAHQRVMLQLLKLQSFVPNIENVCNSL